MNIFRLLGDFSHLAAIIILLLKIWKTRSCAGKRERKSTCRLEIVSHRGVRQECLALRDCLHMPISGFIHTFRQRVQFGDENHLSRLNLFHIVFDLP